MSPSVETPAESEAAANGAATWVRARHAPRAQDHTLLGSSRQWLRHLPQRRRPARLASRYPRIVNRIVWCWSDPVLSAQVLEDLLVDRRGGRTGFAPAIVHELRRLQRFNAERAGGSHAVLAPKVQR